MTNPGWKLLFLTSWGRFSGRFENICEDLDRHEQLIDKEANAHSIAEAQKMRKELRDWKDQSLSQIARVEAEGVENRYNSILAWLKVDESDQLSIFDSISSEGNKYPGTCTWALNNKKIRSFLQQGPSKPVLWLQGNAGSGKSVMVTQLVKFLRSSNIFAVCHICAHSYPTSGMYEQILRSLLLQILRRDNEFIAHVHDEYVLGKKSPTLSSLERLLQTLLVNYGERLQHVDHIWIAIDGLEECETEKQPNLINLVNHITSKIISDGSTMCKFLISSRFSQKVSDRLRRKMVVSFTEEKPQLEMAIKEYTSQRLGGLYQMFHQLGVGQEEMEQIEDQIAQKSDGKFWKGERFWARFL